MSEAEEVAMEAPYQVMPPLTDEEYQALKDDIEANGVLLPVEVDEDGNILDGHHRAMICKELGIAVPTVERPGMSEEEKEDFAVSVNTNRRQLTISQKRIAIERHLRKRPQRTSRSVARLFGVSHNTVESVRSDLEKSGQNDHFSRREDPRTGRLSQPATKPPPVADLGKLPTPEQTPPPPTETTATPEEPRKISVQYEDRPPAEPKTFTIVEQKKSNEEEFDLQARRGFLANLKSAITYTQSMAKNSGFDRMKDWKSSEEYRVRFPDGVENTDLEMLETGMARIKAFVLAERGERQ